jgi:organic hydroperoxide reductase OsmC/OhrA
VAKHAAVVEWRNGGPDFAAGRYSRAHRWSFDGGAVVPASSSPHVVPPPWSDSAGVDPEEALVAAASSCHMLWFLSLAAKKGFVVERYRDVAEGVTGRNAAGRIAVTRIVLRPEIVFQGARPDPAELHALHEAAHDHCFIAASLSTEIVIAESDTQAGRSQAIS